LSTPQASPRIKRFCYGNYFWREKRASHIPVDEQESTGGITSYYEYVSTFLLITILDQLGVAYNSNNLLKLEGQLKDPLSDGCIPNWRRY
jgi:hypothetical protein